MSKKNKMVQRPSLSLSSLDIKNMDKVLYSFCSRIQVTDTCWVWKGPTISRKGEEYGMFFFENKKVKAHRFAFILKDDEIPEGCLVRHACDNPSCVNPDHLMLGTDRDNIADKVARNRQSKGVSHLQKVKQGKNSKVKLTEALVVSMRERYAYENVSIKSLAAEYGLSMCAAGYVLSGKTWTWAGGPVTPVHSKKLKNNERIKQEAIRLYLAGESSPKIGRALGISEDSVRRILKTTNVWKRESKHEEREE